MEAVLWYGMEIFWNCPMRNLGYFWVGREAVNHVDILAFGGKL